MRCYAALVWNPLDGRAIEPAELLSRALQTTSGLCRVFEQDGIKVFCTGNGRSGSNGIHSLAGRSGILLGTVFKRSTSGDPTDVPSQAEFGEGDGHRLLASGGRELVDDYWGRYVAFLFDANRGAKYVVRSPTGELDCLTAEFRGVRVFFSSLADLPLLPLLDLSINWDYVAADLATSVYETRQTGFNEISRVIHGECVRMQGDDVSRSYVWHPARFIGSDALETPEEAASLLRCTAKQCISAWASCHDGVLEMLSGGLDSSIVLGCLKEAPTKPRITGINYLSPLDLSTDERKFARLAAANARCRLAELTWDSEFALEDALRTPPRVNPYNNVASFPFEQATAMLAAETGATALFSGRGGDQLFYQNGARFAYADHRLRFGLRPSSFGIAMDAARLEGDTVWRLMFASSSSSPLAVVLRSFDSHPLVPQHVLESVRATRLFLHPWLHLGHDFPPGKWWHVMNITTALAGEMYMPRRHVANPENLAPLVSQPLVETCLRIPTYVLTAGQWDRALARRAFEADIPEAIAQRRSKATSYESAKMLVLKHTGFLRELLLDGSLVKQRILDRRNLEHTLSGEPTKVGHAPQILMYAACETWIAESSRIYRKAAA